MEIFPYVNCLLVGPGGHFDSIGTLKLKITGDSFEITGQSTSLYQVPGSELGYRAVTSFDIWEPGAILSTEEAACYDEGPFISWQLYT